MYIPKKRPINNSNQSLFISTVLMKLALFVFALFICLSIGDLSRYTYVHWRNLRCARPNCWNIYCGTGYPDGQVDLIDGNGNPYWFITMQNIFTPSNVYNGPLEPVYLGGPQEIMSWNVSDTQLLPGQSRWFQVQMAASDTTIISVAVTMHVTNTVPTWVQGQIAPITTHWRTPVLLDPVSRGTDADGDPLYPGVPSAWSPSGCATWTWVNNMLQIQSINAVGVCSLNYTVTDQVAWSTPLTATITTTNTAPATTPLSTVVSRQATNYQYDVSGLRGAVDADSDPLTFAITGMVPVGCAANATFTNGQLLIGSFVNTCGVYPCPRCLISYGVTDTIDTTTGNVTFTFQASFTLTPFSFNPHWRSTQLTVDPNSSGFPLNWGSLDADTVPAGCAVPTYDSSSRNILVPGFTIKMGTCVIGYTMTDGTDYGRGSITYTLTNNAPVTTPITQNVHWRGSSPQFAILNAPAATDADLDPLSFRAITGMSPSGCANIVLPTATTPGSVVSTIVVKNLTITSGNCRIEYTITDTVADATGSITITVTNTPPFTQQASQSIHWRTANSSPLLFSVLSTPTGGDVDNDPIFFSTFGSVSPVGCATPSWNGQQVSLTAFSGAAGTSCTVGYTITDTVASTPGSVVVSLTNNAPVTQPVTFDAISDVKDLIYDALVAPQGKDPDEDPITIKSLGVPTPTGCANVTWDATTQKITFSQFFISNGTCTVAYVITDTVAITIGEVAYNVKEKEHGHRRNSAFTSSFNLLMYVLILIGSMFA
jgi:hypothetical protein